MPLWQEKSLIQFYQPGGLGFIPGRNAAEVEACGKLFAGKIDGEGTFRLNFIKQCADFPAIEVADHDIHPAFGWIFIPDDRLVPERVGSC